MAANVYVGHYEKQANPIADTDPATVNAGIDVNRDATASFVSGEYDFLVVAKGYGAYRFSADLKGANKTIKVKLPENWASSTQGATATGDGTTPERRSTRPRRPTGRPTAAPPMERCPRLRASRSPSTSRAPKPARSSMSRSAR